MNSRPPITPASVLTCFVALALLAALGSAQLFQFGEAKRRTQCSNNLRQLGLAVHNYHDTYNQLPALATDEGYWTWTTLVLPFLEQGAVYNKINWDKAAKEESNLKLITAFKD